MKKIILGIALSVLALQSCKKDDDEVTDETVVLTVEEQNTYDDAAAQRFLERHYFDSKGLIVAFDETITTDDNYPKLSSYNPVKLPSGVIYIIKTDAQPNPGKVVNPTDIISLMQVTKSYASAKIDGNITFTNEATFINNLTGTGVPSTDPAYFYVKNSVLKSFNTTNSTTHGRSFYEIEGLQEGLKYFKSFELDNSADYNMQGVIIVPSRAAFARDANIYGVSYNNRTFVFNFQLYNTKTRNMETED